MVKSFLFFLQMINHKINVQSGDVLVDTSDEGFETCLRRMKEAEENYDSWLERVRESYGY